MTLFDTDKNQLDRSSPQPNHTDRLNDSSIKAHGTLSTNYTTDATDIDTNAPIRTGFSRLVKVVTVSVINDGSPLTTNTYAHGLPFTPKVEAYLNNATATGISGKVQIPIPEYLSAAISGGVVEFTSYLTQPLVDATNVYIQLLNATGSPITVQVTYSLYEQRATAD